jgi:hypothetical protein
MNNSKHTLLELQLELTVRSGRPSLRQCSLKVWKLTQQNTNNQWLSCLRVTV